ncbi:Aldo/keto reductase [Dentipellis sp. KUC8613]|nr:Aldo/keto reductase [Dentipellis sp. KUC8613]
MSEQKQEKAQEPVQAEYRNLGKSGLRVSVPILGGMTFGSEKWSEAQGLALLNAAYAHGITTIDTANAYSNGASESLIGTFLSQPHIPRAEITILTKILNLVPPDPAVFAALQPGLHDTRAYVNQGGLSRAAIFTQVDGCLARLRTAYVDVLQVHAWDERTPLEETVRALHEVVVQGKARYLGACNLRAWQVAEMNALAERRGWTKLVCVQVEHSLLYRPYEAEVFEYAAYAGLGVLAYSPLLDGHLARPSSSAPTARARLIAGTPFEKTRRASDLEIIRRVEETARRRGWTMAQVALAWSGTKVVSPIVGANSPERLAECVTTGKTLTAEEIKYLEEPYEFQPTRF